MAVYTHTYKRNEYDALEIVREKKAEIPHFIRPTFSSYLC